MPKYRAKKRMSLFCKAFLVYSATKGFRKKYLLLTLFLFNLT
jgi:hypothetical protein